MGKAAKGTLLKIGNGSATEGFTSIYQVRDISGVGLALNTSETTHHSAAMEEVVPTYLTAGEIGFQVNHNPRNATHSTAGLDGDMKDKTERNFEVVVPASTSTAADVLSLTGYVIGISKAYPVGDAEVADVTIKPHRVIPSWSTRASVS